MTTWAFAAVDLPGHGLSSSENCQPTLEGIADVISLSLNEKGWSPTMVVGHSFGGKTVLELSKKYASIEHIWLLDAPVGAELTVTGVSTITKILSLIREITAPESREEVRRIFEREFSASIAGWMTTNLRRDGMRWQWKLDPDFIERALSDYLRCDYWSLIESSDQNASFHHVLAGQGSWWRGSIERRLRSRQNNTVNVLPNAGHWLHVDDLPGLVACFQRKYID